MWDLWWTKWHWDKFLSNFFGFPLSISFHRCSPKLISSGGWTICPVVAAVQRSRLTILKMSKGIGMEYKTKQGDNDVKGIN
jgi:hypothetical protein